MQKSRYEVTKLAPGAEREAVAALARSFFDDAMFSWVAPDPIRRSHMLEQLMKANIADARPFGEMWLDDVHPHDPQWYLAVLGADPSFQRTGAGTALLEPLLARCDAEGLPAYLETQKEANLPWYGRFGFDVVERVEVRACPPIWTMQRAPGAES